MPSFRLRWCLGFVLILLPARSAAPDPVAQEFSGSGSTTTGFFKVTDRWEVRWNARQAVSVAAMSSDGTLVAGASGVLRGSLFVPFGGQFYLKISDGSAPSPGAAKSDTNPSKESTPASWHLQVVPVPATVTSADALTVYTPYFIVPDAVVTMAARPPPPPTLTADQQRSLVTIKGDETVANGFLVRTPDGVAVAASLDMLTSNSHPVISSSSGASLKILSVKAATDRPLAYILVQDDHLSCLPMPGSGPDPTAVGDAVLIPAPGESSTGKPGRIVAMTSERLDFDNSLNASSLGAPVIRVQGGTALAFVAAERKADVSEIVAKAWSANPAPGSETILPFHGIRLQGVAGWENVDLGELEDENAFLRQFHETTRCLDSFINGRKHRGANQPGAPGPPDSRYFSSDVKIAAAEDSYKKQATDADRNQGLDAARELLSDLQAVADTDVDKLTAAKEAVAFDRRRAQEELAYRKALRDELDAFSDNISRLDTIARSR